MATPPESPRSPQIIIDRQTDFKKSLSRRDWIISQIGLANLEKFEEWAFNAVCIIYDDKISFRWTNIHSTKGIPEDADQAVKAMVTIWLARHSKEAKDEYSLIEIGAPCWSTGEDIPGEDE